MEAIGSIFLFNFRSRQEEPTIQRSPKSRRSGFVALPRESINSDQASLSFNGTTEPDRGFRVFKLAESNFTEWDAQVSHDPTALRETTRICMSTTSGKVRTADDILYELLLKSGFPLTTPVEKKTLAGKTSIPSRAGRS